MERDPAYTVVEVTVKLTDGQNEHFAEALSDQLEEVSMGGSEATENFDQVGTFPPTVGEDEWVLSFLGPTHDFEKIEKAVEEFMNEFKTDLKDESLREDWVEALGSEKIPVIESFNVLSARAYQWPAIS